MVSIKYVRQSLATSSTEEMFVLLASLPAALHISKPGKVFITLSGDALLESQTQGGNCFAQQTTGCWQESHLTSKKNCHQAMASFLQTNTEAKLWEPCVFALE